MIKINHFQPGFPQSPGYRHACVTLNRKVTKTLLKAQTIGLLIACLIINRKVKEKHKSIQKNTFETQLSFKIFDNQ